MCLLIRSIIFEQVYICPSGICLSVSYLKLRQNSLHVEPCVKSLAQGFNSYSLETSLHEKRGIRTRPGI